MLTFVILISVEQLILYVFIPKLLYKINAYDFKGKLYAWLADFLQNRKLYVKVGNSLFNCFLQTSGIAQGT